MREANTGNTSEIKMGAHEGRLKEKPAPELLDGYYWPHIEGTRYTFPFLMRYHRAYTLMMLERGMVFRESARALMQALVLIEQRGLENLDIDESLESIHPNVEREVIRLAGYDTLRRKAHLQKTHVF